jgi:GNAT superfamily N-acetyltransferase
MKNPPQVSAKTVRILPVTPARWRDLEKLFGPRGACAGCWCMYWRLAHSQFKKQQGAANKRAFKRIVDSGGTPGLLAYVGGEPVGWCAVAPREVFSKLEGSRILAKVDDQAVWSIVCFFVLKEFRRQGVSIELLRGAVDYARRRGAKIVEGYPVAPKTHPMPDAFAWTGFETAFRKAGFKEVARRSPTRPIMRYLALKAR